jgi:hypothetical protein
MFARENFAKRPALALILPVLAILATWLVAAPAHAEFGITAVKNEALTAAGDPDNQAGSHPYELVTTVDLTTMGPFSLPTESLKTQKVDLPVGFAGDPSAVARCSDEQLDNQKCPRDSQVGLVEIIQAQLAPQPLVIIAPLYNMETPLTEPAEFGFVPVLFPVRSHVSVRTDGDYGLSYELQNIPQPTSVTASVVKLWGVPGASAHDAERAQLCQFLPEFSLRQCIPVGGGPGPVEGPHKPFLTNPTSCEGQSLVTKVTAASWQNPGVSTTATDETAPIEGCDQLEFEPKLEARPTTNRADSPSGLDVNLEIPQHEDLDGIGRATPHLRDAVVTLPEGLVINPSSANGLQACTPAQIGLTTPVGAPHASFDLAKPSCPDSASIGRVEVDTPAFEDPLKGVVYLASPHQNPFGSLLSLYLVIEGHGLVIKLPGKVTTDPQTGRITSSFEENPQLPVSALRLNLFAGALAPLRTPATCGQYTTTSVMTPWSAPQSGPPATPKDEYAISQGAGGASCATSEASLPNAPSFEGGSTSPIAGTYKPFVVNLRREDGSQQFSSVTLTPPPGLLARLAGTATCSDAALAAAAAKTGTEENANPSCPAASQVGTVYAQAGAGPTPYNAPGKAYLAGPYKGASLSLAIVTPATAGPFDLGTIVVRTALNVNPLSAQVTAVSDPIPTILQGIPLDIRSVSIRLDKPEFTLNPTSCDPMSVLGSVTSTLNQGAALSDPFQLGECGRLGFKPKLTLSLKGQVKRTGNPALTAVLKAPAGEANIADTTVLLPSTTFIDNRHISNPCTRVQFNENACPAKSILGTATAYTPLLEKPLTGPIYFRSNGGERELPDLVADLNGQIHVTLVGFIDSAGKKGSEKRRLRTRFENVPDAPVSKVVLSLYGGKRGLIQNSVNLCKHPGQATVQMEAQNGKTSEFDTPFAAKCSGGKAKKRGKAQKGAKVKKGKRSAR